MPDETGSFIQATSVEPEIGTTHLRSHPREDPKSLGCLDAPNIPEPPTEALDLPASADIALPQRLYERVVGEDDQGAAAVAILPTATILLLSQQPQGQGGSTTDAEDDEWVISRIIGKKRTRRGDEYKACWASTWKPESELGNAQRLVQEFEARGRVQHRGKRIGRARTGRNR